MRRDSFALDRDQLARKHDIIFWDDWTTGEFTGTKIPVINLVVYGSHSRRLANRRSMAAQSDLILVDSAPLELFEGLDRPIRRFAYCVNNHLYKPCEKSVDVAYWCWKTPERAQMARQGASRVRRPGAPAGDPGRGSSASSGGGA